MDSLGRVQGIQDPELRDKLQDPVKRSGIYTKDDYEMLKNGQYEEYHQKSIENMCKMGQTVADAIIGMLVPKIDGSTEYQQTKIQESQMAINKLIVTVGDQEDRLTQVEQNIITKDEMITWTTSMQNPQEGGGSQKCTMGISNYGKKNSTGKKGGTGARDQQDIQDKPDVK